LRLHLIRPSVTLVDQDHICWKCWKLISRTITPTPSLFVAQRSFSCPRETWGNLGEIRDGVACWRTKASISLKRVKIEEKLLWRAYRKSQKQTLVGTVQSLTPYGLPFPKIGGVHNPTSKLQSLLSQEWLKLRTANLADTFIGSIRTQAHEKFWRKGSMGISRDCRIFSVPAIISGMG